MVQTLFLFIVNDLINNNKKRNNLKMIMIKDSETIEK